MMKLFTAVALVAALAACSDPPAPVEMPKPVETPKVETPKPVETAPTPVAVAVDPAAAATEADAIFNTRCAACHGVSGKGDGIAAASLTPKPRDYTDKAWQASIDDNYLAKVIVEGGVAVGKSPMMVPNVDLKDKPEVVKALVAKVRTFAK